MSTDPGHDLAGNARVGDWLRLHVQDSVRAWDLLRSRLVHALRRRGLADEFAEDLVQTSILRWLTSPRAGPLHWPPDAPLDALIAKVARDLHIDWLRQRRPGASLDPLHPSPDPASRSSPVDQLDARLDIVVVAQGLPPRERKVIERHLQGHDTLEVIAFIQVRYGVGSREARRLIQRAFLMARKRLE